MIEAEELDVIFQKWGQTIAKWQLAALLAENTLQLDRPFSLLRKITKLLEVSDQKQLETKIKWL